MHDQVTVIWAREDIPAGPSIFLAGPTPRDAETPSWRPEAIELIEATWRGPGPLLVLAPESAGGLRESDYDDQVDWEVAGLESASAILFWIPRDVQRLPGFTTNVEFGLYANSGRAVLGCPPDCPNPERNRYLIHTAHRFGLPVVETLSDTVTSAIALVRAAPA
ncbi:nucleoside 2-deoxyribosyltransferase domain-containing protein [Nocardia sp. CA-107356]|uniref:nucleoside 2-deoxyribosyltransferase domain-containing protein n=1 Tax=Nocardia sp. CA-107356 TaxID=3239972 RepID=UPI003D9093F1